MGKAEIGGSHVDALRSPGFGAGQPDIDLFGKDRHVVVDLVGVEPDVVGFLLRPADAVAHQVVKRSREVGGEEVDFLDFVPPDHFRPERVEGREQVERAPLQVIEISAFVVPAVEQGGSLACQNGGTRVAIDDGVGHGYFPPALERAARRFFACVIMILAFASPAAALAAVTMGTKFLTGYLAARKNQIGIPGRWRAGLALTPRGEFSIIIAGLAISAGLNANIVPFAATYMLMTVIAGPVLARLPDTKWLKAKLGQAQLKLNAKQRR